MTDHRAHQTQFFDSVTEKAREYYGQEGYLVLKQLIPLDWCDAAVEAFRSEIKPYQGFLYRQTTANPEKHELNSGGLVLNPLLNPLSVRKDLFPSFYKNTWRVLVSDPLYQAVGRLRGESCGIVQSMYFESAKGTWAHQDSYYLDSERIGQMIGAWIALEDIPASAGRFYIVPGSHRIDMERNGGNFDIAFNHARYKSLVESIIEKKGLPKVAPALEKGDVLFWGGMTIHGSHAPTDPEASRSSYTAHFIPLSARFLQYQCVKHRPAYRIENGKAAFAPKDQNRATNRWMLGIESSAPKVFQALKRVAMKSKIEACRRGRLKN